MTNLPRLYPGHQHRWTDADPELFTNSLVRCTVCGFQAPRNVAGHAGQPAAPAPPKAHTRDCLDRYHAYLPCNCDAGTHNEANGYPTDGGIEPPQPEQDQTEERPA